jgi:hypothetical protein
MSRAADNRRVLIARALLEVDEIQREVFSVFTRWCNGEIVSDELLRQLEYYKVRYKRLQQQ